MMKKNTTWGSIYSPSLFYINDDVIVIDQIQMEVSIDNDGGIKDSD